MANLIRTLFCSALLGLLAASQTVRAADQVITIPLSRAPSRCAQGTLRMLSQRYILTEAPGRRATAILLLLPGGAGKLDVADGQLGINSTNFLVRSRHLFAALGFHVAVMDAATDFLTCTDGLANQRTSAEFTRDMQVVVDDLRRRYPGLALWVVGTSRGSTAAAQAGAYIMPPLRGIVLTSPITVTTTESVFAVPLQVVTAPALIVTHLQDGCSATPPAGAELIRRALTSSRKVGTDQLEGGYPPLDVDPCEALAYHGFFGMEPNVVERITMWIKQNN